MAYELKPLSCDPARLNGRAGTLKTIFNRPGA